MFSRLDVFIYMVNVLVWVKHALRWVKWVEHVLVWVKWVKHAGMG